MSRTKMAGDMRPEDALVFCCARTHLDQDATDRLERLIDQGLDWRDVIQRAIYHRVVPLLYQTLKQRCGAPVPPAVMGELQNIHGAIVRSNLLLLTKLLKVITTLEDHQIRQIPFKGLPLAVMAYGNFGLRQFGDLDVLVHPDDYDRTRELFLSEGYREGSAWGWESSMVDPSDGIAVDIHSAITPVHFPVHLDFARLQGRLRALPVGGREIRSFGPEDMLIILCIQLAKDSWGVNALRLSKLCDIAELLRMHPGMDWAFVSREARRLGARRVLALGLELAREILGAPIAPMRNRALNRKQLEPLRGHVVHKLLNQGAPGYARRLEGDRFHFLIRERWRDKLSPHIHDFRRSFVPSERDRQFLALPRSLNALYFLVRPLRVARDLFHAARADARRR